jgi:hypothetical protein
MERKKSVSRAKKSATTVAELLAKEGISVIVPGGGLMYDAAKVLVDHAKSYFSDRTAKRIEDFHSALLVGKTDQDEWEDFLKSPFEPDDYYAVLSSCVQDIETEKVEIYSSLMNYLIESELGSDLRRHFIKSCKELTYSDLSFLQTLYINSKHDLMTVGGTHQQLKTILSTKDPLKILTIEKLKSFGFIPAAGGKITPIAEQFVHAIFSADKRSPVAVGRKKFTGITVVIVTYQLDEPVHKFIATEVQEALWSRQIKSSIHIIDRSMVANSIMFYGAALLIVGDKKIEPNYVSALLKFSEKRPIIRLNIVDTITENGLESIHFSDELNYTPGSDLSVRGIVYEYIDRLSLKSASAEKAEKDR